MKKWIALATGVALAATATASQAADKLTLQLQWVTQAQFAGYYVAKDKGYYADEDLEVEIRPGVLMSLIGGPFFLYLLMRERHALRMW